MENEGQIPPAFHFEPVAYIDRIKKECDKDLDARCEKWDLKLAAARKEWDISLHNLIERYETSEKFKAIEKIEVDKHFERINGLQERLDRLTATFLTADQVDMKIGLAHAQQSSYMYLVVTLLVTAIGVIGYLLERR